MKTKSEMYAERDGIFVENVFPANRRNYRLYHIPCAKCGRIVKRKVYNGDKAYYCDICKNDLVKKEKTLEHELLDEILSKGEQRFIKAKDKLLKQVKNPEAYANAIRVAETRANSYGSIPEVMVAIEQIARDLSSPRSANMVLLGMAAPYIGILQIEQLRDAIITVFSRKGQAVVEANLKAFDAGVDAASK